MDPDNSDLLKIYDAAAAAKLPAFTLMHALLPSYQAGTDLDRALADPEPALAGPLNLMRQWSREGAIHDVSPIVIAAGLQAVSALGGTHAVGEGLVDAGAVRDWLAAHAQTVTKGEKERGVERGPDFAVIAACRALAQNWDGARMETFNLGSALTCLADWSREPEADLYELVVSACWFALAMTCHVFGHDWDAIGVGLREECVTLYRRADQMRRATAE